MRFWKRKNQAMVEVEVEVEVEVGVHGDRDFQGAMIWAYRSIADGFFHAVHEAWELWRETSGWPLLFRETAHVAELPTWSDWADDLRPDESGNPNNQALAEAGEWLRQQDEIMYGDLRLNDALHGAYLFWLCAGEHLRGFPWDQLRVIKVHDIGFLAVVYLKDDFFTTRIERRAMNRIAHKIKELGGFKGENDG